MARSLSRWTPTPAVRSHSGGTIPAGTLFFAPPPAEIGSVRSAQCGLRTAGFAVVRPIARKVVGLFMFFGILVMAVFGGACDQFHWPGLVIGALLGLLLIGLPIHLRERKRDDCTYVGTHGIARFPISGRNQAVPAAKVLLFADATYLQTAYLGRKSGTNFNFQWKEEKGRTLYKMEGGYYGNQRDPDFDAAVHFATAAEEAWTQYILPMVKAELERTGAVKFIASRGTVGTRYAVVRRGSLEVISGEKQFFAPARDLEDILVFQGYIIITRKDAKPRAIRSLDGSDGVYYLSYGAFLNVKAFLFLLNSVVGVTCRHSD